MGFALVAAPPPVPTLERWEVVEAKEATQVWLHLSAPLAEGVEASFASPGRFVVRAAFALKPEQPPAAMVARGAIAEVRWRALAGPPPRTEVQLWLNTPVECRARLEQEGRVLIVEAKVPPPVPKRPVPPPPPPKAPPGPVEWPITVNFVEANLVDALKALALQGERNIAIAPNVQGTVTLQLKGVTLRHALDLITRLNGLTYREVDGTIVVGPPDMLQTAFAEPIRLEPVRVEEGMAAKAADLLGKLIPGLTIEREGEGRLLLMGTRSQVEQAKEWLGMVRKALGVEEARAAEVVPLQTLSAETATAALQAAVPGLQILSRPTPPALVLVGTSAQVERAKGLLAQLDVAPPTPSPPPPPPTTEAYIAQHADPWKLRTFLNLSLPQVDVVVSEDFRALVLTGPQEAVQKALQLLGKVDIAPPTPPVAPVEGAPPPPQPPPTVVRVHKPRTLSPVELQTVVVPQLKDVEAQWDEKAQFFLLRGTEEAVKKALETLERLDPLPTSATYEVRYIDGRNLAEALRTRFPTLSIFSAQRSHPTGAAGAGQPATILMLTGRHEEVQEALRLLEQLDSAPRQVLIEAVISDISPSVQEKLGVNWSAPLADFKVVETRGEEGFRFGTFSRSALTFSAVLEALRTDTQSKILARPQTLAVDGSEAQILIGQRIPYEVSQIVGGTVVRSVEFEEIGINLRILPRVTADGHILASIEPQVSSFQGFSPAGFPIVATRQARTTVFLQEGDVVVIGGLLREEETRTMSGIPLLKDIPVFGELFRFRSRVQTTTELVLFVTCRIPEASAPLREER